MMGFRDTIKQWFQTNDTPTEDQFSQTMDKIRMKDELIPVTHIEGLVNILNAQYGNVIPIIGDGNDIVFEMQAGVKIESIIFKATSIFSANAINQTNGDQLVFEQEFEIGSTSVEVKKIMNVNSFIKVSGLPNGEQLFIQLSKIF